MPSRMMYTQTEGLRRVERPGARWGDEVGRDETMLGIRSWWQQPSMERRGGHF